MRVSRHPLVRLSAVLVAALALAASPALDVLARDGKAEHGVASLLSPSEIGALSTAAVGPLACEDGMAGPFPCEAVDLASLVTIPQIGAALGSDVWGWHDEETGREIAIPTTTLGAAFVDVTEPSSPTVLGRVLLTEPDSGVLWRDVKVHDDHAFIVSEHASSGMVVFDLRRLRDVTSDQGVLQPDLTYDEFGSAHNIAVNTDTGYAYVVGTDTCDGGLHMVDVQDPSAPAFVGCFAQDGYTHDVECVVYDGPDTAFRGREICFASNEDTLTIVDVTDKASPVMLSRTAYDTAAYTHQGSLTPDHRFFVFGDELDESEGTVASTATYVSEVADLSAPGPVQTHLHDTASIDHNLYVEDDLVWQANYAAGLRVLDYDLEGLRTGTFEEVGHFDVLPGIDVAEFAGAWTAYPYFPSGTIVLNSFDLGMFVLRSPLSVADGVAPAAGPEAPEPAPEPTEPAAPDAAPADEPPPASAAEDAVDPASAPLPVTGGGLAAVGGLAVLGAAAVRRRRG